MKKMNLKSSAAMKNLSKIDFVAKAKKSLGKIRYKEARYALPTMTVPVLLFIGYQFSSNDKAGAYYGNYKPVTEQINTDMPEAQVTDKSRMRNLEDAYGRSSGYTGMKSIDKEQEKRDLGLENVDPYSETEKDRIDSINAAEAAKEAKVKALEQQLRGEADQRIHRNRYSAAAPTKTVTEKENKNDAYEQYARDIQRLQRRLNGEEDEEEEETRTYRASTQKKEKSAEEIRQEQEQLALKEKTRPRLVEKAEKPDASYFNSLDEEEAEDILIKAMMDQTVKVQDGTRIRLKLLDDVMVEGTLLPEGTYLYALVSGFSGQRVMATVTSILYKNKFIPVNLSVYDNDGMAGFYVPTSMFRELMRDAEANALSGANGNFNNNGNGSTLSAEQMALQSIQSVYSGVTSAIGSNIRKNKAKIKYNTIVYLINTAGNARQ